jgi:ABC-type transporter Mla subunit MlaD
VSQDMPAEKFGRIHHLPAATLAAVADRMRARGLIDNAGRITDSGRETRERIEARTDDLAAPAYDILTPTELQQLIAELEPLAATLAAAGSE